MKERNSLLLIVLIFLIFFFMPIDNSIFNGAILNGVSLLHEYATEHFLTCLLPAFFIAGAIIVFIRKETVLKYLGPESKKYISYSIASVSGAVLAVCSCTILPLFAGIRKGGAGLGPAVTFLFSGPAINIAAIFLTFSVLGFDIGFARIIFAIILSIIVGLSMELIFREKIGTKKLFFQNNKKPSINKTTLLIFFFSMVMVIVVNGLQINTITKYVIITIFIISAILIVIFKFQKNDTKEWLSETWKFSKLLIPYLFIGVFIAGFIIPILPQEIIESVVGQNTLFGNLVASVFGAFMYFSTLTEVPILQALMAKGMSNGPALALLLAGPSLSLPNMLVVKGIMGTKKTLVYIILVVIYSTIAGLIFGSL
ncbi:permease [Candidatus Aenigmatarchaeota archaeon]